MSNVKKLAAPERKPEEKKSPFITRSLGKTLTDARNEPPQKKLIGGLISEGEQVILFGDTNTGKSLLAMQFAIAVAKGEDLVFKNAENEIRLVNECAPKNVLYLDLEHSDKQLEQRIDLDNLDLQARENIFLAKLDIGEILEGDKPEDTFTLIKEEAERIESKFIVIDNISAISGDLEKSENAKKFLSPLWKLCRYNNYTVLILAHTPKLPDNKTALNLNKMAGSKKLPALVDSVIGIAEQQTNEDGYTYIKQLKSKTGVKEYGLGNVLCSKIEKVNGIVQHVITHTANELDVISSGNEGQAKFELLKRSAITYLKEGSLRAAGDKLNVSKDIVSKRLKKLKEIDSNLFETLEKMNPLELDEYGKSLENPKDEMPF